jgi:hypothetical protein
MPSSVRSDLNKRIGADFTPLQFQQAVIPIAAFTYRVSEPLGLSMTGYEATMFFDDNVDNNINNGVIVEMIENLLMPSDQDAINAILTGQAPNGNSIFFTATNALTQYITNHRQYNYPIQLRYGTSYTVYVRGLMAAVLTNNLHLMLTIFGFPNADQNQPVIQLR